MARKLQRATARVASYDPPPGRGRTLGIDVSQWGFINSLIRMGVWASFLFLLLADRFGRRNLMMLTVIGFALFNGMTAFVTDKFEFVVC